MLGILNFPLKGLYAEQKPNVKSPPVDNAKAATRPLLRTYFSRSLSEFCAKYIRLKFYLIDRGDIRKVVAVLTEYLE